MAVKYRAGKKFEIQLPSRPVNFSFHLPSLKDVCAQNVPMYVPWPRRKVIICFRQKRKKKKKWGGGVTDFVLERTRMPQRLP